MLVFVLVFRGLSESTSPLLACWHSLKQNPGVKVGSKLGDKISAAANALGGEIDKLGALAVGLAQAAWDQIKKFINCLSKSLSLCNLVDFFSEGFLKDFKT